MSDNSLLNIAKAIFGGILPHEPESTEPCVNVDGTPMVSGSSVDIDGKPYGVMDIDDASISLSDPIGLIADSTTTSIDTTGIDPISSAISSNECNHCFSPSIDDIDDNTSTFGSFDDTSSTFDSVDDSSFDSFNDDW